MTPHRAPGRSRSGQRLADRDDFFKNEPPDFAPGEKWRYNICADENNCRVFLSTILEKYDGLHDQMGKPLARQISEAIWQIRGNVER